MLLFIDYGYDIHRIELNDEVYKAFMAGQKIEISGQGFVDEEDGEIVDHWVFNRTPGEIYVWFHNGRELYANDYWFEDENGHRR